MDAIVVLLSSSGRYLEQMLANVRAGKWLCLQKGHRNWAYEIKTINVTLEYTLCMLRSEHQCPPKFHMLEPNTHWKSIKRWGLWRIWSYKISTLIKTIHAFVKQVEDGCCHAHL